MKKLHSFSKKERLINKKHIELLFNEGISLNQKPLRLLYRFAGNQGSQEIRVLITVPRKKFKKAVVRNRLRRLIKEAYRLQKHLLTGHLQDLTGELHIAFIYTGEKDTIAFRDLESSLKELLLKMSEITG